MAERTPLGPETSRPKNEWTGEVGPEEVLIDGKIRIWDSEICRLADSLEHMSGPLPWLADDCKELMRDWREHAAEVFPQSGEEGEEYQFRAVMYYVVKLCLRRIEMNLSADEIQTLFLQEQAADRIVRNHLEDFRAFFGDQMFRLTGAGESEKNRSRIELLTLARERYDLRLEYDEVRQEIRTLSGMLDQTECRQCREDRKEIDALRARLDGERIPAEELREVTERLTMLEIRYNQQHEAAEELERTIMPRIERAREREERLAYQLDLEVPHTNPACAEAVRRLREGGDEGRETASKPDVPPMTDPKIRS